MKFSDLYSDVIANGLCTGCGTCAGICPTRGVEIHYVDHEPEPALVGKCTDCSLCFELCPGKDIPFPAMERMVFGRTHDFVGEPLGIFRACLAGYAGESSIRAAGASGGVVTALLVYALEQGLISGALVGRMDPQVPWRSMPVFATTREGIVEAAQSKYQVVATNAALKEVLRGQKSHRIGHVGLACHIHGLRKVQMLYPNHRAAKALDFTIGLFCHANFYTLATELLILERCGVESLDEVASVEYRAGEPPGSFVVTTRDGRVTRISRNESVGMFFIRYFRRDRCLMCVDWSVELADISVGDYWGPRIPEKGKDMGWSSIIVRTEKGEEMVRDAEEKGYIVTYPTDPHYLSMSGGLYQKKHGAAHNLLKRYRYGWPTPDFHFPIAIEPMSRDLPFDTGAWPHLKH